jgi:hypothetical protein
MKMVVRRCYEYGYVGNGVEETLEERNYTQIHFLLV